jgi:hypothetical protein
MGDLINLNEWVEARVNKLAQRYRRGKETSDCKKLECELKEWGHKMAKYKTHFMRIEREQKEQAE